MPDGVEETVRYLDHPRFLGVKLHPLLDGHHPDDPMVHPIHEAAIAKDVPLLIHLGNPIFALPWSIEEAAARPPEPRPPRDRPPNRAESRRGAVSSVGRAGDF